MQTDYLAKWLVEAISNQEAIYQDKRRGKGFHKSFRSAIRTALGPRHAVLNAWNEKHIKNFKEESIFCKLIFILKQ